MSEFKDVTIGEGRYRITKMAALPASRIHNWILSGASRLAGENSNNAEQPEPKDVDPEKRADGIVVGVWVMASTVFSEELSEKVQVHCLHCCQQYPADAPDAPPTMVMTADGRWVAKSLENDSVTVNRLVLEALKFNISPFFIGNRSSLALGA